MLGGTGCKQQNAAETLPLPVRTALVQPVAVGNGAKYSASIVPYAQVTLSFQSSGYVGSIRQVKSPSGGMRNVDQGDWVEKGTVLAVVRQQDYQDKVQQAQAQVPVRRQNWKKQSSLSIVFLLFIFAERDQAGLRFRAGAAHQHPGFCFRSAGPAKRGQRGARLCSLKAPFNGWIVSRNVDLGTLVGPATNGFTLADTQSVKAVFGVPDTSISRVRLGQCLAITRILSAAICGETERYAAGTDLKSRVFSSR